MTTLLPILALSALVLIFGARLLVQSLGRRHRRAVSIDDFSTACEALNLVFVETAAIHRIFSVEDLEFISRSGSAEGRRLFLKERRKLALQWLRKLQKQVAQLMDLHLRLAGYTDEPSPGFELKLSVRYLQFVVVSKIILFFLWVCGPFRSSRTIAYSTRTAGNFCTAFSLRLERVNPARLNSIHESLVD